MSCVCRPCLLVLICCLIHAAVARGQQQQNVPMTQDVPTLTQGPATGNIVPAAPPAATGPAATAPTTTAPATAPTTAPASVALADLAEQAEATLATVRRIEQDLPTDPAPSRIASDLPLISRQIDEGLERNARLVASRPSLEVLQSVEEEWAERAQLLTRWRQELVRRGTQLDRHVNTLTALGATDWLPAVEAARKTGAAEVAERIDSVAAEVARAREAAERARARALSLQNRVSQEQTRVADAITSLRTARDAAVGRIFVRDSPPIWSAVARPAVAEVLVEQGQRTFTAQLAELRQYVAQNDWRFILHLIILLSLIPALFWARKKAAPWAREDPALRQATLVFDRPVATGTLLALLVSGWVYPDAPRLLWAVIVAAALVPTILILRRMLDRALFVLLDALVVFYVLDQVRALTTSQPLFSRLLLMLEMLGGVLFVLWLIRSGRLSHAVNADRQTLGRAVVAFARAGVVAFVVAFVAAAVGYVTLANLVGNATLGSAYMAVILYAASQILGGLIMAVLRMRPLTLLAAVRRHRRLIGDRLRTLVQWAAVGLWVLVTLQMLAIRGIVFEWVSAAFTTPLTVGAFSLSLGMVAAFVFTVWAAFVLSRFIRFLLEEDVYPRFGLARGVPYAISTVLHYTILVVGFVLAVGMLGYDMTKFTILAGAFGVGLGFGLQTIFNNFISGLILLFERPIKVGDVVQIGPDTGTVRRIGIRASIVRLTSGAEIIMPNGKLIADPVINWTFTARGRAIELQLAVANTAEPRQVIALWAKVTAVHPRIVADPPPKAVLVGLAGEAMQFNMRAWTSDFESWGETRSDLAIAMSSALKEAEIPMK